MTAANPEKTHEDHAADSDGMIDILTSLTGVLSTVLAIILTIVNLLLEPSLGISGFKGSPIATTGFLDNVVFFTAIVAMLVTAALLNDLFTKTRAGRRFIIYASLALGLLGALLYFAGAPSFIYLMLTAVSISLFALIWGAVLSTLKSRVLTFILMSTSVLTGIVVLIDTRLGATETFALLVLLYIISWLSLRRISRAFLDRIIFADRQQSIERHVRGKGNSFTLVLVGGMFGIIAVLIWSIELTLREMTLALGTCLLLAGLIIAFFYRDLPSSLGDVAKRLLALIMIVGLMPFPFLDRVGQMVCICFLFVAGTVNLILIIDSILETSRFNQISPFWIIGLEGGVFFAGVLAVLACATISIVLNVWNLEMLAFTLVGVSSILQIYINNQTYPLFRMPAIGADKVLESRAGTDDEDEPETSRHGSAFWRGRIDRIAVKYKLSDRQKEIMELLLKGRDLYYITMHFGISRSTAKTHVSILYRKMNVHSKQELIDLMELLRDEEISGQ